MRVFVSVYMCECVCVFACVCKRENVCERETVRVLVSVCMNV